MHKGNGWYCRRRLSMRLSTDGASRRRPLAGSCRTFPLYSGNWLSHRSLAKVIQPSLPDVDRHEVPPCRRLAQAGSLPRAGATSAVRPQRRRRTVSGGREGGIDRPASEAAPLRPDLRLRRGRARAPIYPAVSQSPRHTPDVQKGPTVCIRRLFDYAVASSNFQFLHDRSERPNLLNQKDCGVSSP